MKKLSEVEINEEIQIKKIDCERKCKKENFGFGND